jgi:ABC-2 type transport system permease protein
MKALHTLTVAAFKQFYRDKVYMFFTFIFPLFFIVIFGLVWGNTEDVSYDVGLVESGNSTSTTQIVQGLNNVPVFNITEGNQDELLSALKKGDLRAVIVLPQEAELGEAIAGGTTTNITIYYDPSQTSTTQVILPIMQQVVDKINQQITQSPTYLKLAEEPVQARNLRTIDYMVPGILAMAIMTLGLFGGLTMVEWREKLVLKRFSVTPTSRTTLVTSQTIYRLVLSLIQAVIIIIVARLLFKVEMVGNWFELFGIVLLGTLSLISIGYLVVSRIKSVESANVVIQVFFFPMMLLSGIFFPLEFMPGFMRNIAAVLPVTYLGDALRQVMVSATPVYSMPVNLAVISAWSVVCAILAIRFFKWE